MSIMVDRDQDGHSNPDDANRDVPRAKSDVDPLAELARLIGQADPFANFGRANPSHPTRRTQPVEPQPQAYSERVAREASDDVPPSSGPSWMKHRTLQNRPPLPTPSPVEPAVEDDTDINAQPHPLHRYSAQHAPVAPQEPYPSQQLPAHASPSFAADSYAHEQTAHDPYAQPHAHQQPEQDGRYDDALYGAVQPTPEEHDAQQPHHGGYVDDGYGYPDDGYTDPEQRKPRKKGLMTVAAVVALAVIGTGGAYAYRNFVASPRSGEPPVIKADTNPIKVVPPTNSADAAASGKLIQDRIATGNGAEKLVSREETPVDPRDPSKAGPRVVFPPLNANGNPPATASVSPAAKSMTVPASAPGDEPRKIKTFTVKGDQTDTAGVPVAKPAPRNAAAAAKQPATNANASANAPMSLSPGAAPAAGPRVAAITPVQSPPGASGGYVVQVASQRNEADAQASFKALQGKYPAVLGSRSAQIKRADLGEKGTYYRAVVGPFNSSEDASAVCGNLKSAGGQCVVQRN